MARRQKFDECGTAAMPQSVISKENKWNNQMTHGMCLWVCCMCSVMREGMFEKNPIRSVINLMVWLGDGVCDDVDCRHSI